MLQIQNESISPRRRFSSPHTAHSEKRVLVVEDDVTMIPFWSAIFLDIDPSIELEWAENFSSARQKLTSRKYNENPYDLVVADVFLSGKKTGLELWDEFCDKQPHTRHPFLIVSAASDEKIAKQINPDLPKPEFLKKPLNYRETRDTVDRLLWFM